MYRNRWFTHTRARALYVHISYLVQADNPCIAVPRVEYCIVSCANKSLADAVSKISILIVFARVCAPVHYNKAYGLQTNAEFTHYPAELSSKFKHRAAVKNRQYLTLLLASQFAFIFCSKILLKFITWTRYFAFFKPFALIFFILDLYGIGNGCIPQI